MTDGQTYYDGLIAQGYPAEQALGYTQQYYPGFSPAVAAPAPMPMPAPIPAQPVAQAQAIPQPQPMAQPMAQTIPLQQPMMNAAPVGMAPMGMAPMAMAPAGDKKPIMAWAAVGCLTVTLVLAISVQFTNTWLVDPDEEDAGFSWGLNSVSIDCPEINGDNDCSFTYIMLRDGYDDGIPLNDDDNSPEVYDYDFPEKDSLSGSTKVYCDNTARLILEQYQMMADMGIETTDDGIKVAEDAKQECLEMNSAGTTGGLVIWVGALGALVGTLMLVMNQIGKTLPSNAERYGKLTSWVSGGFIILGAVIWMIMKPTESGLDEFSPGLSFYLTIIAGILAITAGVLEMLDKKE